MSPLHDCAGRFCKVLNCRESLTAPRDPSLPVNLAKGSRAAREADRSWKKGR